MEIVVSVINMAKAKWARINPAQLMAASTGGMSTMIMATAAKKHVTIFSRKRTAVGAGSPEIKTAFARAARQTKGTFHRIDRNEAVAAAMASFKGRVGPHYRRSKSQLHQGEVYQVGTDQYQRGRA